MTLLSQLLLVSGFVKGLYAIRTAVERELLGLEAEPVPAEAEDSYYLSPEEITRSRFGATRDDLHVVSDGNTIQYLPNGDKFMPRIYEIISAAKEHDFIFLACWELNEEMILDPRPGDAAHNENTKLINAFDAARLRGVEIKILYTWGLASGGSYAEGVCERVNKRLGANICILDNRHGHASTGSSHMKVWAARLQGHLVAFSGSMDTSSGRFDTADHCGLEDPKVCLEPTDAVHRYAWHGSMYEIQGGAAEDILTTFVARWNDPVKPQGHKNLPILPSVQEMLSGWETDLPEVLLPKDPEQVSVQVVRTVSCSGTTEKWLSPISSLFQNFAPSGEYTVAASWYKSLSKAKKYIFVADQFMHFDEALAAVIEAAAHVDFVIILTDKAQQYLYFDLPLLGKQQIDTKVWETAIQYHQWQAIVEAAAKKDPTGELGKKLHMFSLMREDKDGSNAEDQIYDHEKTLLIDDEFALVGSAGVERASFTNDNEVSIAVESKTWVQKLRKKIFAEFLLLDPSDPVLESPDSAFGEWMRQADLGTERVRHYNPNGDVGLVNKWLSDGIYNFVEPDGRCGKDHEDQWPGTWGYETSE